MLYLSHTLALHQTRQIKFCEVALLTAVLNQACQLIQVPWKLCLQPSPSVSHPCRPLPPLVINHLVPIKSFAYFVFQLPNLVPKKDPLKFIHLVKYLNLACAQLFLLPLRPLSSPAQSWMTPTEVCFGAQPWPDNGIDANQWNLIIPVSVFEARYYCSPIYCNYVHTSTCS